MASNFTKTAIKLAKQAKLSRRMAAGVKPSAEKVFGQTDTAPQQQKVTHTFAANPVFSQAGQSSPFNSNLPSPNFSPYRGKDRVNFVQKRTHITVAQGSGHAPTQPSTVSRLSDFHSEGKSIVGGPGADAAHDTMLDSLALGASQSVRAQKERLNDHLLALCVDHDNGDTSIHLGGHSRGGGNAKLLADYLHHNGLVHPKNGTVYRRPGKEVTKEEMDGGPPPEGKKPAAIVDSLNLVDTVPEMGEGHMTVFNENGFENVPYEHKDARIPYNVRHVNNVEAESEERLRFRQLPLNAAQHPSQKFGPNINTRIVPNSVHSDVGGAPGFNPDAGDVSTYWLAHQLHKQYPKQFKPLNSMQVRSHNEALDRLNQHTASPGLVEGFIGWATGTAKRTFTDDAKPMEKLEDEQLLASLAKEQSRVGDRN